jgi:hypothetical protein
MRGMAVLQVTPVVDRMSRDRQKRAWLLPPAYLLLVGATDRATSKGVRKGVG